MSNWQPWWFDRIGAVGGSTVTSVHPEPQYGAALDIATANLTPEQFEALLNDIQTVHDDEESVQRDGWWADVTGAVGSGISWVGDRLGDAGSAITNIIPFGDQLRDVNMEPVEPVIDAFVESAEFWNQVLSTPQQALNIAEERREGFFDFELLEGETWSEAWKRAEYTTLGQGVVEAGGTPFSDWNAERRIEMHRSGFNSETGLPVNPAYADIRLNDPAYNITSGTIDFIKTWYADPTVIGGKAIGLTRALVKADLERMPAPIRRRFEMVIASPADEFEKIKASASKLDPITQRAIAVREGIDLLRDRVRKEELSVPDLARMQWAQESANGATAANAFVHAARAKKIDPQAGILDEFDDDLFQETVAAMMGHTGAMTRLIDRRDEIGDSIRALVDQRLPSLDEAVRSSEARLAALQGDPTLVNQEFRLADATMDVEDAVRSKDLAEMELRQYHGYADWITQALEDVDVRMVPREGYSIGERLRTNTASVYRPTSHAHAAGKHLSIPRAVFMYRAGIADLHRPQSAYDAGDRYMTWTLKRGEKAVEAVARNSGYDSFAALRDDKLSQLAAATTDTQRRDLLMQIEDIGFRAVAASRGFTRSEAREIVEGLRTRQRNLVTQMHQQAQNTGNRRTFTIKDSDGSVLTHELPFDVTDLENYFIGADLDVLDHVLKEHGPSIKAALSRARRTGRDYAVDALSSFNHYWKPAVLFRLGYPIRTLTDETARTIAATGSLMTAVEQTGAFARGLSNIPKRFYNRTIRAYNTHQLKVQQQKYPLHGEVVGPESIPDVFGTIDTPDPARMDVLQTRARLVEKWTYGDLSAAAKGRRFRERVPAYVTKLNNRLEGFARTDSTFMAFDPVTLRNAPVSKNIVTPYEHSRMVVPALDSKTLIQFVNNHAEALSNPNAVLMVRKGSGQIEVEIGFRIQKSKTKQPVRGALFYDSTGQPVHAGPKRKRELKLTDQAGEGYLRLGDTLYEDGFGPTGGLMRAANSSAPAQANLHRGYEHNVGAMRAAMGQSRTLTPKDADFTTEWGRLINRVRTSPIIRRILDGMDDDEIVEWLTNTREGRQLASRIPKKSNNPRQWVAELRVWADQLLPTERLRALVREGQDITPQDLDVMVNTPGTPVPLSIDGMAIDLAMGDGPISRTLNRVIEKGFNVLATLPSDTLVRNPFFLTNYRHRLQQIHDTLPEFVRPTAELKQAMEKRAREHALHETRKYLFSLADGTQFTHMLRFFSPFAGAWQETMVRWFRIFTERPESFARLYINGWADMHELYGVQTVDENGQIDPNGENVLVPFPGPIKKLVGALPGISESDLEGMTNILIPKNSLNVTLQGEPFWLPGPGPVMQLPAKYLLEKSPYLADENTFSAFLWSWLFPIGVPESAREAISPSWVNQVWRTIQGIDDPVYSNLAMGIYKDEVYTWRGNGKVGPEPTFEDALEKAQGVQLLYVLGRLGAPFSFRVQPDSQMFIDKAREYREQYGWEEGLKRFVKEVGDDAYLWWTSMSKTNLNVAPTSAGFKGYQAWKSEIEKYPELAEMFVGLDAAEEEFNYSVYELQGRLPISPGDPTRQRSHKTPTEAIAEIESLQGWQEYRNFQTAITAELQARGLTSIRQKDAQDLLMIQRSFIDQQRAKLPGWAAEYDQRDTGRTYRLVQQMREALQGGKVPDRPDWHGISEYVQLHDAFAAELDARALTGGSRNIEAETNKDLAVMWEQAVGRLVAKNLMFADIYYKFLDGHTLTDGSH